MCGQAVSLHKIVEQISGVSWPGDGRITNNEKVAGSSWYEHTGVFLHR